VDMKTGKAASCGRHIIGGSNQSIELTDTPCLLWLKRDRE
jgi:hypothetical protein